MTQTRDAIQDFLAVTQTNHIVYDRPLGTLEQSMGVAAAEAEFNQPDPFEEALESAAAKLGGFARS